MTKCCTSKKFGVQVLVLGQKDLILSCLPPPTSCLYVKVFLTLWIQATSNVFDADMDVFSQQDEVVRCVDSKHDFVICLPPSWINLYRSNTFFQLRLVRHRDRVPGWQGWTLGPRLRVLYYGFLFNKQSHLALAKCLWVPQLCASSIKPFREAILT